MNARAPVPWRARTLPLALACALTLTACPDPTTAQAPENAGDVHVSKGAADGGAAPQSGEYEYVVERPLAVVALAEARNVAPEVAHAAIDRLADRLDICATEQGSRGRLTSGAGRVVALIGKDGSVGGTKITLDADDGGASTAVLCLIAPLKELAFPPTDSDAQRGLAIEAMWGSGIPHSKRR